MPRVSELLSANLHDVFGNRDPIARRKAIQQVYSEDVVFTDPSTTKQQLSSLVSPGTSYLSKMASDTSAQTSERSRGHSARLAHQLPAASMSSPSSTGP